MNTLWLILEKNANLKNLIFYRYSNCRSFVDKVRITTDAILVNCYAEASKIHKIYTNTHATAIMTDKLKSRIHTFGEYKPPSVLILGIDSISRSNFFRTLVSTSNYLKQKKWINFKAYNKVGYNTFPNVMAMLTGRSLTSIKAFGKPSLLFINTYDLIWKDYQRLGYVTAYAEDLAYMNTFTYTRKGFKEPPTDFYYRPYTIATETLKIIRDYSLIYCAGPESYGERILNIAEDFADTFAKQPNFGLFWMNSFSHDDVNTPARMDEKLTRFLQNLERRGIMNNSIIIFLSDHGARYGRIRHTSTGWLEERLPFLHFWIPENFRKSHKREYLNLQKNSERLTTPYDLYMTLQHILVLSGARYKMRQSVSCRKCTSLFKEVASVRSCGDASIDFEYCACIFYVYFNPNHPLVSEVAKFVLKETRRIMLTKTSSASKCATLEVKRIRSSRIATNYYDSSKNLTFMHIQFETKPRAMLEAIVRLENNNFGTQAYIEGEVHRLDLYKYTSWCVEDEDVKKYCICRWQFSLILRRIREWLGIKGKRFI